MSVILLFFICFSIFCSIFSNSTGALSAALMTGAGDGISLAIKLAGPLCLWSGLTCAMEKTGLIEQLSKVFAPILKHLFPQTWQNKKARNALCGNFSANLLGLGSAATPLGIQAACSMAINTNGHATDELCKLIVLNTASVQLIPSTVAALRASLGAVSPFDIMPAVWVTSLFSVTAGLLSAKVLAKWC